MSNKPFSFTLFGQPATKKNSASLFRVKIKGKNQYRPIITPSDFFKSYQTECRKQLLKLKCELKFLPHYTMPVRLVCKYYLTNKAHYPDLIGLMQATADIISNADSNSSKSGEIACKWLLSDDRIIKSWDGTEIAGLDKNNPRTEISIIPLETDLKTETDPYIIRQLKEQAQGNLFE